MANDKKPVLQDVTNHLKSMEKKGDTGHSHFRFSKAPVYNIDDMDHGNFMRDHRMEGVYCIECTVPIDEANAGKVYVNGEYVGEPIIAYGGNTVGLPIRKKVKLYDHEYTLSYRGCKGRNGEEIPDFTFTITTLPKVEPGSLFPEHDELVLQAAREGAVLLKNNNSILPLAKGSALNVFGKGGPTYRLGCVGAGKIFPRYGIRFEEGIRKYSSFSLNEDLFAFYAKEEEIVPTPELLEQAKALSDIAVVVLTRGTGESQDNKPIKGDYYLTDDEHKMFTEIKKHFDKLVVILNIGYPIEMGWIEQYQVDAVLWPGLNGMAGGRAVAELLEGTVSPSGRLPDTWPMDYYDIPAAKNFYILDQNEVSGPFVKETFVNTVYEEGLYVGYRYFETFNKPVAFPFGHGLSYTVFEKEVQNLHQNGAQISLDIAVKNIGTMSGKETVLIFAQLPDGKLEQPSRRLVAFGKTQYLEPGMSETLHFNIDSERFQSYDEATASWIIEKGDIALYLGGSVKEAVTFHTFHVEDTVLKQVQNRVYPLNKVTELSKFNPENTYPTGEHSGKVHAKDLPERRVRAFRKEANPIPHVEPENLITFPMLMEDPSLLEAFVGQLNDYELCRMSSGGRTGWGYGDNGFAGCLYTEGKLEKFEIPEYYMADGNNGLNLYEASIGFPVSNTMCATFNEELVYLEGRAIAREGFEHNLHCILAPAMNLHRNPLCGRHSEYFSEDPYLAGRMGGMECKGLESMGMATTMKHFFANNAENYRTFNHSIMSERVARELYLEVFRVAMDVHMPSGVMTGYNPSNGCWCAADDELLEGILREEWGYTGFVMTDWGTGMNVPNNEIIQSGNSWIAPGSMDDMHVTPLLASLADGTLDKERLRRNVYDMYANVVKMLNIWKQNQ